MTVVGQSVPRVDAFEKVIGKARYADDYTPAGCLYLATVRSRRPHVKILRIDPRPALEMKGVHRVITARDIPGENILPLVLPDYPFLAHDRARFIGEALALVVADTQDLARLAAEKVLVLTEELPFVTDPLLAMEPGAPEIYTGGQRTNVFRSFRIKRGDVERAFHEADVVVERSFRTGYQVQAYLETQGMVAEPGADGSITVHGSMQCPFYVHDAVAAATGLKQHKIRIVQRTTGGGFGGKEDVPSIVAAHAAIAALAVNRPVKLIYTREEDFLAMSKRHPSWSKVRYAAKQDGTITGCEVKYVLDGGAYATLSPVVLFRGTVHAAGPYRIEAIDVETHAAATNKVPCGAYRGFGQPQICFAQEQLIDELAGKLGMDPFELRKKNMLHLGDRTATGQKITESCGFDEVVDKVTAIAEYRQIKAAADRHNAAGPIVRKGVGLSMNYYGVGLGAGGKYLDRAGAFVQIEKDGSVIVAVGNTEIGQGARTVLAQLAADALGAPIEAIHVLEADTTRVPDSGPTVASRTTLVSGNAIQDAARQIRATLDTVARELAGAPASEAVYAAEGGFTVSGHRFGFAEVVKRAYATRRPAAASGWWVSPDTSFDAADGQGDAYVVYAWSCNIAEVEVDTETGDVRTRRVVSGHDVGKAIHPLASKGQIEGGVAQGVGYATIEHLVVDENGVMRNNNFTGYVIPTSQDAPEIVSVIVEHPYSGGPQGAKGLAESPIVGPGAAVACAVAHAIGKPVARLPMTPEYVRELIHGPDPAPPEIKAERAEGDGKAGRRGTAKPKRPSRSKEKRV